jgi:transcriptional regulator GlxA family with amidase domain
MQVVILVPQGAHSLEVSGPRDVFAEANLRADKLLYDVQVVTEANAPIECDSGLRLIPDKTINEVQGDVDTLIVAGPRKVHAFEPSPTTTAWLRERAPLARRYGSVCTGAFVLGPTGLLDGRHVTTHWEYADDFAKAFPAAILEADHIFVRDGPLFTSAGVTAGIDLTLALIEEDHGRELALSIARWLVMFLKRSGGQSQFSVHLAAQIAERSPVEHIQHWILDNPRVDLSVKRLANRAGMSERNFSRVFHEQTGMTPGDYVEATRIDAARRLLESTRLPLQRIASDSGFANSDVMRRAFLRRIGVTPLDYRRQFQTTRPSASRATAPVTP